jgi:TRAP-type C4-dicarboxylate transport system substrate-binding protein
MLKENNGLKKIIFILILSLIISAFAAANVFAKTTLTFAEENPPTGYVGVYLEAIEKEIEARTEGEVEVEMYPGESLLTTKEIFQGVRDGIADIGKVNPNHYPEQLYVNGIFAIFPQGPVEFENLYEVIMTITEEIPDFNKEFEAYNQKILGFRVITPTSVFSTTPFTSFEDFKGKKIRTPSRWWAKLLEGAGASTVSIPHSEAYMALQTGDLDGTYTDIGGLFSFKMHEPAPHIYLTPDLWTPIPMYYTINLDEWNSFSEDIQKKIQEAFDATAKIFGEAYAKEWDRIVTALEKEGAILTQATPEEIDKFTSMPVVKEMQAEWIAGAKERGIENPEEIVSKIEALIAEGIAKEQTKD